MKPFADAGKWYVKTGTAEDDQSYKVDLSDRELAEELIKVGDLRRAARALSPAQSEKDA